MGSQAEAAGSGRLSKHGNTWCQPHTGLRVGLFTDPDDIDIRDIAQSFSEKFYAKR